MGLLYPSLAINDMFLHELVLVSLVRCKYWLQRKNNCESCREKVALIYWVG